MKFSASLSEETRIKNLQQTRMIVWGALFVTVFFYGFVAFHNQEGYRSNFTLQAREGIEAFLNRGQATRAVWPFVILGLLSGLLSIILPGYARRQIWDQARASKMSRIDLESRLFVPYILAWAFSECVAIFGYLISHERHVFNYFIPFGVMSLVLMFIHRPQLIDPKDINHI